MKKKLQVFISSTYHDLPEERQAAVRAVLKAGHIPAGMELFTAGDKSQMETINRWIAESDVYMLILGGRYGSLEPTTGVSYTELEYDYAVEQEKPLFAIVIEEDALEGKIKEQGSSILEKENPKQLKMFREKVLSNISSFFVDSKDIKLCIYESLSDFAETRDLTGWVSGKEIPDTKAFLEEISRLINENEELKEELSKAKKRIGTPTLESSNSQFEELKEIIRLIEVTVPAKVSGGIERETNLLEVFVSNKENFVTGVNNKHDVGAAESFLYFNICPKLQIHGLVVNEKVASVQWRRFAITKKGSDFLAYIDRLMIKHQKAKGEIAKESPEPKHKTKGGPKGKSSSV
ncbi:MAG: DUF4062 domain-containing protein [Gammaproteobacteria bacterium]|nr:DUF4062 domain-containing protein [Gammaproteobacteria bacterium]